MERYRPSFYCVDANMSLLETMDLLEAAHARMKNQKLGAPYAPFRMSVAAWFPFHYLAPKPEGATASYGLGLDSTAIFSSPTIPHQRK